MSGTFEISPQEESAILAEWDRLLKEPMSSDTSSVGCVLMLIAGGFVILGPRLLPWLRLHVGAWVGTAWIAIALVILLYGLYEYFFGNRTGAQAHSRSNAGLTLLAQKFETSSAEERRQAAVAAIFYAYYSGGPYLASSYEAEAWREKLGSKIGYLMALESALVEKRKDYTIFTKAL